MSDLLHDVNGATFASSSVVGIVDTLADDRLGEVARVRLDDGSIRLVEAAQLQWLDDRVTEFATRGIRSSSEFG